MLGDYLFIILNLFYKNNLKKHCITSFLLYYFTVMKNIKKGNGSSKRDIIRCLICPKNNITMKKTKQCNDLKCIMYPLYYGQYKNHQISALIT